MAKSQKSKKPQAMPEKPISQTQETLFVQEPNGAWSRFWQNTYLQAIIIGLVSFLLYTNTLSHQFCQDDAIVITENMFTTEGVKGIGGILKYDTFYGFFKEEGKANLVAGGRYRPFTLIMFAIEHEIFGKNPFWGHLFNLLWFSVTCVVLYFLLLKLLQYRSNTEGGIAAPLVAFATALLFAVHPIHTEVVANIKGRDEIMALLGSLSAVWFSLKAFEKNNIVYHILSAVLFFVGLMSKENAITFIAILPLIYWFFVKTTGLEALRKVIPFVITAVLFIGMRANAMVQEDVSLSEKVKISFFGRTDESGKKLEINELMNNPYIKIENNKYVPFETGEKMATIIYTLGKYIQLLIFPHPLTHDYYPRHIDRQQFGSGFVTLSMLLYVALIFFLIKNWQKRDLFSFGIAFFLITLSIVSNLVFPVGTNMAERFAFMPSVGFCFVVALFLEKILRGGNRISDFGFRISEDIIGIPFSSKEKMILGSFIVVLALMSLKTLLRNPAWKDDFTLFSTDVKVSENSAKVQCSVGGQQIEQAIKIEDKTQREALLREAIEHLTRSTQIHPNYKEPYNLLGNAYTHLGETDKAIAAYQTALKLDPDFKVAQSNLQLVSVGAKAKEYKDLGLEYGQKRQDFPKAIEYFKKALEISPDDAQIYSYLGTCYGMSGQPQKAIEVLEKGLSLRFDKQDAMNLSESYRILGNIAKAEEWKNKK